MEPEVVGTTGISSGAEPRTHGIWSCGALALIIIVLKYLNENYFISFQIIVREQFFIGYWCLCLGQTMNLKS